MQIHVGDATYSYLVPQIQSDQHPVPFGRLRTLFGHQHFPPNNLEHRIEPGFHRIPLVHFDNRRRRFCPCSWSEREFRIDPWSVNLISHPLTEADFPKGT